MHHPKPHKPSSLEIGGVVSRIGGRGLQLQPVTAAYWVGQRGVGGSADSDKVSLVSSNFSSAVSPNCFYFSFSSSCLESVSISVIYTGTDAIFCYKIWRFGFWICWEMQYQELRYNPP
ncbi:unnamed protein product [Sphagnum compactum]